MRCSRRLSAIPQQIPAAAHGKVLALAGTGAAEMRVTSIVQERELAMHSPRTRLSPVLFLFKMFQFCISRHLSAPIFCCFQTNIGLMTSK